jgi:hypothetical protein
MKISHFLILVYVLTLAALPALMSCSGDVEESMLVGTWEANNAELQNQHGPDVLVLHPDGTMSRHYEPPEGPEVDETGQWRLEQRDGTYYVLLRGFSDVYAGAGRFRRATNSKTLELSHPLFGDFRLWFDREKRHYYLHSPDTGE